MPHSLRAKLSGLHYKGILEDKDYKRLCHALDLEKAEQEQKSGKWIEERDKEHGVSKFTCSQCGNVISDIKDRITFYTFNRFCGRCGAKMQESEEISERNMKMWKEIFKAEEQ